MENISYINNRDIPKFVSKVFFSGYLWKECPTCRVLFNKDECNIKPKRCCNCGQLLKWYE